MLKLALALIATALTAATEPSADSFFQLLSDASGPTLMAIIIVGALREWWVPGKHFTRVVLQRDELIELMARQTFASERMANAAEHVARRR